MTNAKHLAAGLLLAVSLTFAASPALAADRSLFAQAQVNLVKGSLYYVQTVTGWFESLAGLLRNRLQTTAGTIATPKSIGSDCVAQDQCKTGLACLNTCPNGGTDCEITVGRCAARPSELRTIGQNGDCTLSDICATGTACTKVCPSGLKCRAQRLCLPLATPAGACNQNSDCRAACADRPLPPIGDGAFAPTCENNTCHCRVALIDTSLVRLACPTSLDPTSLICPYGTAPGCTSEGCASGECQNPRATCLKAPEFGGACFEDNECSKAACPTATTPFCSGSVCKCHSIKAEALSCRADGECAGISCEPGQVKACVNGACACGVRAADTGACKTSADCQGNCPESYSLACVDARCACQRTTQAVPVSCTDVSQCGAINCPTGFNKDCLNSVCACTRVKTQ